MKKSFTNICMISTIVFIMFTSCTYSQSFIPVKGRGVPVDRNFDVSDFNGIEVSGGFDVTLVQGNSEALTLTAQENLFDHIIVKVDQGILRIYTMKNMIATQQMKARVTFRSINNLKVSGGGDVISETPINVENLGVLISGGGDFTSHINTGELKCQISGGGDAEIEGDIENYNFDMSGGGDTESEVNARVISCRIAGGGDLVLKSNGKSSDAAVDISGGGDMEVEINAEKLKCSVSGGGDATLSGQASDFEINLNGGGDVNAGNLFTKITSFHVSGGSDLYVNASQEISGNISGGGDVYYSGNPEKTSINARGGSEVHKK